MKITFFEKKSSKHTRYSGFFLTSLLVGILISYQYQSYQKVTALSENRDVTSDYFQELNILLRTNSDLKDEIESLAEKNEQYEDRAQAALALANEIAFAKSMAGETAVKGSGIEVLAEGNIEMVWFVDFVNELFAGGAEAVSINGIRLVNATAGFYPLPGGRVMLNGTMVSSPFRIEAIGEGSELKKILNQPGGIIARIRTAYPESNIEIQQKEVIEITKVL